MTDGYRPKVDESTRNQDHAYWNARCRCGHPRREHSEKCCLMAGCDCRGFVVYYDDDSKGQLLPYSYA
jgi:hypothetical protein